MAMHILRGVIFLTINFRSLCEKGRSFLVDILARHALYSGRMVCGALRRTVLRLHQSLRRGGWVPGHVSTDLALDSTPCGVETWPGNWPHWAREQEQTDERNPDDCPPSQAAPACPNPDQRVSDDHLAFPMAWDDESSTPASHV